MTYFPHYISCECLSSYDKYFINVGHKTRFVISNKISIPISYHKIKYGACINIKIKYAILFMKFIIKVKDKKLFCRNKMLHANYEKYFEYILNNNIIEHIEIFLRKYYPFVENSYNCEGLCSVFNQIYKKLSDETLSLLINLFSISTLSLCINNGIGGPNTNPIMTLDLKILKKLLRLFIKKLTKCLTSSPKYFTNKYHIKSDKILTDMYFTDLHEILKLCAYRNNPDFFKYTLKKLSSFFDNMDVDDVKNKILYDSLREFFEYNKKLKWIYFMIFYLDAHLVQKYMKYCCQILK
ncbi:hypothetical protein H012_gp046 [Acanthamoeba polyphaga moumouvirus]|uniref:Uncharacterized protein n=1 Tax=Acanthamoeba polyphaga moumouvirus TaxID=1269028 RepID=L7RDH2_9VIRU|nr:hypothetical protein H012_gp046 [Acanthamoeba polyphaga moumouvirus]AGC02402.1 hypothetical protein Moumou_00887 [Acanthamoeba polyphaga moumouvirus]